MWRQYYCTDTQAGKTILASVIIEECKSRNLYLTSYYYCNNDDPTKSSSVDVIKGIIEQIVHQYPKLMAFCHSKSEIASFSQKTLGSMLPNGTEAIHRS
jgi:hypothetical protein